jgi:predicted nuclease of predicted toxin-antitoxin system
MRLLVDMNLSPDWCDVFEANNIEAVHWSSVGKENAPDAEIMSYARTNGFVVFTHDLDFGIALALTKDGLPSVVQVRTKNPVPEVLQKLVIATLRQFESLLEQGALVTIDESRSRVRILPLQK